MKKLLIAFMATVSLLTTTAYADIDWYEAQTSDPFSNDLFEVVSEVKFSDEIKEKFPDITQYFRVGTSDDFEIDTEILTPNYGEAGLINIISKKVNVKIDYEGNAVLDSYEEKEYGSYEEIPPIDNSEYYVLHEDDGKVVDGLSVHHWTEQDEVDPNYSFEHATYKDINGNDVADFVTWYCEENYSNGLIHLVRDMNYGVLSGDKITYIFNPWENNKEYYFDGSIYGFNDDGYALYNPNNEMECTVEDKYYIIKLKKGIIPTVTYNGEKITFDQIPVIDNGRTLVPVRAIFEKLGATVDWNADTQTVIAKKDETEILLTIDNTTAVKNGEDIAIDVPAKIINGRTLVPVRFIADCFEVDVEWDGIMQRVSLTSK